MATKKEKKLTRSDFLKNPRAQEIRDVVIKMANAASRLLYYREVDKAQEYALLEHLNGRLIELGITAHMHVGLPKESYLDPVITAEYDAGQWMSLLQEYFQEMAKIKSEAQIMPIIQEHSEQSFAEGQVHVLSGKNLPDPLKNFILLQSFVNLTYRFLDANEEERKVY